MTKDEILNMPAGREMDALIAEHVMKFQNVGVRTFGGAGTMLFYERDGYPFEMVPKYSRNIAAAWEVVQKIDALVSVMKYKGGFYECAFVDTVPIMSAEGETAPLAICRAALLAVCE